MQTPPIRWIQALRGIAAMMIVVVHERFYLHGTPSEAFAETIMRSGGMGVDLFFLISGFIMVHATRDTAGTRRDAGRFFVKRFARIWPVYLVLSLIAIPQIHGFGFFAEDWLSVAKAMLFLPVDATQLPYLGLPYPLGWTLNYEIYFYGAFGLSMLFGAWRWHALFGWFALTLIALPLLAGDGLSADPRHAYGFPLAIEQMVNPIIFDFVAGAAIGLFYLRRQGHGGDPRLLAAAAFAATVFALCRNASDPGLFHGIAGWGWPLALSMLALAAASHRVRIPSPEPLVWLGKISFSLYLTHPITLRACNWAMSKLGLETHTHTWGYVGITMLLVVMVATLSWRLLEQGLSNWLKNRLMGAFGLNAAPNPTAPLSADITRPGA